MLIPASLLVCLAYYWVPPKPHFLCSRSGFYSQAWKSLSVRFICVTGQRQNRLIKFPLPSGNLYSLGQWEVPFRFTSQLSSSVSWTSLARATVTTSLCLLYLKCIVSVIIVVWPQSAFATSWVIWRSMWVVKCVHYLLVQIPLAEYRHAVKTVVLGPDETFPVLCD